MWAFNDYNVKAYTATRAAVALRYHTPDTRMNVRRMGN